MSGLPETVLDILMQRVLDETSAAWLLLDKDRLLKDMGGSLATFGLEEIEKGCVIQDQAVFLEGILSMDEPIAQIESVQIDNGEYADIYSVENHAELWIILLGRTESSRWKGVAQQKSNDLSLLQHQVATNQTGTVDLCNLLGIVALERNSDDSFRLIEPVPDCFSAIFPAINNQDTGLQLEENFAFLAHFLEDCQLVWEQGKLERLKSGPWIEVNSTGKEYALEATAILWEQRKLLFIELLDSDYQDQHALLQHGRENELIKQSLEKKIYQQNLMEQKLIAARALADGANQAKTEFLSAMSHELRTPLNAILGFSQLLMTNPDEPLSEEQQGNMQYIFESGTHLLKLINKTLDLSKVESGKIDVFIESISPYKIINECMPIIQILATKQQITFDYRQKADVIIQADAGQFRQIVINLLNNSVKYSHANSIVTIEELVIDDHYRLLIKDKGIGIAENKQNKLFTAFERLGLEQSKIEGTGIGLTVTKAIVEAMDGHIGFESVEGDGSIFWVEFPLGIGSK